MRQYLVLALRMLVVGSGCGKKGDPRAPELVQRVDQLLDAAFRSGRVAQH